MDTKQEFIEIIKGLLSADDMGLDFLNRNEESELKTLIASIRHRLENQETDEKS